MDKIKPSDNGTINVLIEISMDSSPIKYEYDKDTNMLMVDRFMPTSMRYPCNYGFVPNTLSGDGDPLDVLVYTNYPVVPGALIKAKPIGVLITEDENGMDEKVLAVPTAKIDPCFSGTDSYKDMPEVVIKRINHFFEHYKDLEANKWVKVKEWQGKDKALAIIEQAVKNFKS